MKKFGLLLVISVSLMLGTACQKAADRSDNPQGQQGNKPTPDGTVKSKITCDLTRTYTTVKDGVSTKSEMNISYTVQTIDKDIDSKTTESDYKMITEQKWFSVAEDGTKTQKSSSSDIEVGKSVSSVEETEPNIFVLKERVKGTYKFLNSETQKYETEDFDHNYETKDFNDGETSYAIYSKIDDKDQRIVVGRYKLAKSTEQDGRIKVRTKTLIEPVKDNQPNVDRTMETSVKTCREETVDSVDLAMP